MSRRTVIGLAAGGSGCGSEWAGERWLFADVLLHGDGRQRAPGLLELIECDDFGDLRLRVWRVDVVDKQHLGLGLRREKHRHSLTPTNTTQHSTAQHRNQQHPPHHVTVSECLQRCLSVCGVHDGWCQGRVCGYSEYEGEVHRSVEYDGHVQPLDVVALQCIDHALGLTQWGR